MFFSLLCGLLLSNSMMNTTEYTDCIQEYSDKFMDYTSQFVNFTYPFSVKMGAVDFINTNESYLVMMDTPGMGIDNIDIKVYDGNVLSISGERVVEQEGKENSTYFERSYGKFSRSFELNGDANLDNMNAELSDGVLTIEIPRIPTEVLDIPIVHREVKSPN